jgi:pyrroline-5-carboxylate reductase
VTDFGVIGASRPLVLVGGGRMGSALLAGWLGKGLHGTAIMVVEPDEASARRLKAENPDVTVIPSLARLNREPAVMVLAVKPQVMGTILDAAAAFPNALFLSIAAGKTLDYFAQAFGAGAAVVRAMPNTPAAIGKGVSVCVASASVTEAQRKLCTTLLAAVGAVAWIDNEKLMDAVTALSGSGPAYVFYLIECMAAAGQAAGLPAELAEMLARQTVAGAGALVEASDGDSAATLRRNVTSPNGTTEAALNVLMGEDGLALLMRHAIEAAARRSKELSA